MFGPSMQVFRERNKGWDVRLAFLYIFFFVAKAPIGDGMGVCVKNGKGMEMGYYIVHPN